jgi:hypothetical protein
MSVFNQTPEERLKAKLPRFLVRPPQGDKTPYEHDQAWEVTTEWSAARFLKKGWEAVPISCHRPLVPGPPQWEEDREQERRARREQVGRWADAFVAGGSMSGLTWPEDERAVLEEVARRLCEATADGFLLRSLAAVSGVKGGPS